MFLDDAISLETGSNTFLYLHAGEIFVMVQHLLLIECLLIIGIRLANLDQSPDISLTTSSLVTTLPFLIPHRARLVHECSCVVPHVRSAGSKDLLGRLMIVEFWTCSGVVDFGELLNLWLDERWSGVWKIVWLSNVCWWQNTNMTVCSAAHHSII